ncbi:hypothetical protein SAMN03159423_4808 [Bradyrhizobium sp. NFR13]|uniref:hypothetical protein n=1 Tax=Bradyrhizobium sp. NFR13 TaxID=1566285 RepID=UPI0008EE98B8|nr:hypothetical protein [Bradyrhizobium sp. NFR13]SFL99868.1 hypothetical protein SAMN03159423_4808 [Bradyrhizobium sp. NFR13]
MTISDEMVERCDLAACKEDSMFHEVFSMGDRQDIIRAIVTAALQDSVVVPAEPTIAMIEAADIRDDEYYINDPAAFVTEIWQKMVAASQVTRHDGDTATGGAA